MSTSTALALLKPDREMKKPTKRDQMIWLAWKRGQTAETIAAHNHMKEPQVRAAIDRWQLFADVHSNEQVDLKYNQMFEEIIPMQKKVLLDAMKADHVVNVGRGKQVIMRKMADHTTRLESLKTAKALMEISRPKGGGININTQVNNDRGGVAAANAPRGFDFEARLRDIRASKGIEDAGAVIDAEFEDEEKDELADELAEMGIELEPDEDEDEDEDEVEDDEDDE